MSTPLNEEALAKAAAELFFTITAHKSAAEVVGFDWKGMKATTRAPWETASKKVVSAYLAVAQPVVNSVEELDALPDRSVVLDAHGAACQRNGYGMEGNYWDSMGEEMLSRHVPLPATVLYRPEVSDD